MSFGDAFDISVRDVAVVLGLGWVASSSGVIDLPSLGLDLGAATWAIVGTGAAAGLVAGPVARRIWELIPDDPEVIFVELNATDDGDCRIWTLNREAFSQVDVTEGTLHEWPRTKLPTYEVREFDPSELTAVGTWRDSRPESDLLGHEQVSQALEQIDEIRGEQEQEARYYKAIRRRLPSIIRRLDAQRAQDQAMTLEGHLTPALQGERVNEVLQQELDDDLLPARMKADEDERPGVRPDDDQEQTMTDQENDQEQTEEQTDG